MLRNVEVGDTVIAFGYGRGVVVSSFVTREVQFAVGSIVFYKDGTENGKQSQPVCFPVNHTECP